jgi:16S rRNA (cytosine1402-N4)-methyltransferase
MAYNEHVPVLLGPVLSFVRKSRKPQTYVDLTLGRAGHASEVLKRLPEGSAFYGVDFDPAALAYSKEKLAPFEGKVTMHFVKSGYAEALPLLKESGVKGADFILMDIGVSSPQFDDPERGFSYRFDGPLDMRMDPTKRLTAAEIVNTYSEKELYRVFEGLGEVKDAKPVVRAVLKRREEKKIQTTMELVDLIKASLPQKELRKEGHPAKQYFLGLRYEVNGEIDELRKGLDEATRFLNPKGRLVVITFNSEEDRIVKHAFKALTEKETGDRYHPILNAEEPGYLLLTKKPVLPSEEEIQDNHRAKSSILRAIERR